MQGKLKHTQLASSEALSKRYAQYVKPAISSALALHSSTHLVIFTGLFVHNIDTMVKTLFYKVGLKNKKEHIIIVILYMTLSI